VFSINTALFKDLRYDPLARLRAHHARRDDAERADPPSRSLRPGSLKELVDYMKKNPGKLSYCSSGTGSSDHLTAELRKQASGTDAVHVPYKGGAACQTDIMGNQVDFSFQNLGAVTNYIQGRAHEGAGGDRQGAAIRSFPTCVGRGAGFAPTSSSLHGRRRLRRRRRRRGGGEMHGAMAKALRSPEISERG